jgi:hypothetical protein
LNVIEKMPLSMPRVAQKHRKESIQGRRLMTSKKRFQGDKSRTGSIEPVTAFGRIATVWLRPSQCWLNLRLLCHFQSIIDLDA